ncbi:hypothetical protein ACYSNU_08170 [Enterococcus sp. LJL120]
MAEAIVIVLFLLVLLIMEIREQRQIIIKAQKNRIKLVLSLVLSIGILAVFWPNDLANQIKLLAFVILILSVGFLKEGLANNHIVRLGVLNGQFEIYDKIEIEELAADRTFITFYHKKNSFSMFFSHSGITMQNYFAEQKFKGELIFQLD